MPQQHRFASKLADFNNDMNIIVPYLNDPANTNRLHVSTGTGGNLPISENKPSKNRVAAAVAIK